MPKIVIRRADALDFVKLLRLLTEAKDPPGIRVGALNPIKISQFLLSTIQGGHVAVADLGGNIVGTMACAAILPPWSDEWVLSSEFVYVQPAHRAGGVPRALMANVLKEARRAKVNLRLHLSERDIAMIGDMTLKTSGMRPAGRVFLLSTENDNAGLPSAGIPEKRDDVGSKLADDGQDAVPPRSAGEDDDIPAGPPEVEEPPADWG